MPRSPWLSSCVSFRRRGLLARLRRRLTGTPSLAARLAGYGIGVPITDEMREADMRAEWVSPLPLGDFGQVSSAWPFATHTHISPQYVYKSASRNTGGNTAATGAVSTDVLAAITNDLTERLRAIRDGYTEPSEVDNADGREYQNDE